MKLPEESKLPDYNRIMHAVKKFQFVGGFQTLCELQPATQSMIRKAPE
jgi:hypothetical protein